MLLEINRKFNTESLMKIKKNLTNNLISHINNKLSVNHAISINLKTQKNYFSSISKPKHERSSVVDDQLSSSHKSNNNYEQIEEESNRPPSIELDIDLNALDLSCKLDHSRDYSFKYGELFFCKIYNYFSKIENQHKCRVIKLKRNGILQTGFFDIWHEHVLHKSQILNAGSSKSDLNSVSFQLDKMRIEIRRPSLYEFVSFRIFEAVPSHFSILTLVPMLLEIEKDSKVLESGTGSGTMTLFLSKCLGRYGVLHTFDVDRAKSLKAKEKYLEWKESHDLSASENEKWADNVKFGSADLSSEDRLNKNYENFYDAIYLDMGNLDKSIGRAYSLLKPNGVLVLNAMHLTQILQCLRTIEAKGLHFENELVLEPANRFWEMRRLKTRGTRVEDESDQFLWTCRLEDRFLEKRKRGGLFFNYWQGYLAKFRKIK